MNGRSSSPWNATRNAAELLEPHIPGLRRYAYVLLRGDREGADDLVQDSLERALSRWHQRRRDENLRGWVYAILHNRFITDQQRRQRRQVWHSALTKVLRENLGIDGGQEGMLAYHDLLRGFAELPEEQQSVLLLVGVDDFTYREAARILGVPIGTVMSRLSRSRERLRQYMNTDPAPAKPGITNDGDTRSDGQNGARLARYCLAVSPTEATERVPTIAD